MKNNFFHFLAIISLTILTQIGGIVYLVTLLLVRRNKTHFRLKRLIVFAVLYVGFTFLLIPNMSPYFGRIKITDTKRIGAHSFFTKLLNRNYVKKEMYQTIADISEQFQKEYPGIKVIYLDANFPFFDGFPLLPHLSHNDGKKIDLAFIYKDTNGTLTNLKKTRSGYGAFVNPSNKEFNQNRACKDLGYWQYDFSKRLTFGKINDYLKFSHQANYTLVKIITNHPTVEKVFIEPYLKDRLKLNSSKIRFQGCRSVRHDDHIHLQIK